MADIPYNISGPHRGQRVVAAGDPVASARFAMVMVHGRGAEAQDILSLVPNFARSGFAYLAPEASGNSWYPNSFLAPIASNEPGLSSALALIDALFAQIAAAGIPAERTLLLGFSQGACLSLEYAVRHARRYAGLVGLSGGLIGPDGTPRDYPGSLAGTPVFLGCSDVDPHVPKARVDLSAEVLERLGGAVTKRIYPNMGHTVELDEIDFIREMIASLPV